MHADREDLADLVLDPDGVAAEVHTHVAACTACRGSVEELAALLAGVRAAGSEGPLVPPTPGLRDRVLDGALEPADTGTVPAAAPPPAPHPGLTSGPPPRDVVALPPRGRSGRGVPVWAAGLAAAVTLAAGVGLGRLTVEPTAPERDVDVVASADLTSLEGADPRGLARAVRTATGDGEGEVLTLRIDADALEDRSGIHEVWLLNVDGTRMVAVGLLAGGDDGEFEVPVELLDEGYRIVDISVEPDDGDPTHSGVSLARGELT